jgi:hypothetical protein
MLRSPHGFSGDVAPHVLKGLGGGGVPEADTRRVSACQGSWGGISAGYLNDKHPAYNLADAVQSAL